MGPVVVSPDDCPHSSLALCSRRNGEVMQESNTSKMIFSVEDLVAYISQFQDLEVGDVISTGTPGGVGVFRDPPVFLEAVERGVGDRPAADVCPGGRPPLNGPLSALRAHTKPP